MSFSFLQIVLIFAAAADSTTFRNKTAYAFSSNVTDQQALLSVKSSITGDPLGVLSSWNHSVNFCHWEGVTCSRRHQRVTELDLSSKQLEGTLSPHIANLTFLRAIDLRLNNFYGSIPSELGQLFRLQHLLLRSNSFQGAFPNNLTSCSDIRSINMYSNKLEGKIPTYFASWPKLNEFNLGKNLFIGSIPPSLGNISSLSRLFLERNNLVGSIPSEVASLFKLEYLALDANNLSGTVPVQLYNISSISVFSLTQNQLEGRLPADLGLTLPNLREFYVALNYISGPFPLYIANASNLVELELGGNKINGPIPMNLGSLSSLEYLSLANNPLGHNSDLRFLNSLVNCTRLNTLFLARNGLGGKLPNSIINFSIALQKLDLFTNYIHGSIPQEIGKLANLTELALGDNIITGEIPESIGQLSKLGKLLLYENNISGDIPASIGNITGLLVLSLYDNMLQGSIPTELFNISTLLYLGLYSNHLSGVIPEQIVGLSSQCVFVYLDQNLFRGPLPSNIGNFKNLIELTVFDNELKGEIPTTLGKCVTLERLYMNGNHFEGSIPPSLKDLRNLVFLDLSSNNFSGNIPSFLGEFRLIQYLNLSHNKLEGKVPQEGPFENISAFSISGNLQLCGGIRELNLPACPDISSTKKKKFPLRTIPLVVLLPLAILLACFALILYKIKKSKQKKIPISVLLDDQYPRLSYQDLLLATDYFSPNNLLGEGRYGSVYKGFLESLQQIVAVKVLNAVVSGAKKSFLVECETLRNIRHRNLIKIIAACSSTDYRDNDFRALVLEFMTNGSLDNWLHPSPSDQGNERNLTLLQRLNIAIDVALALDYLHHQSHTTIVHCDIKPSNILLDEDFAARVGDFGLAKIFSTAGDTNQAEASSTGVRGTVGYVPPEYGMGGEISTEGDVYSYGILILEIFSGKSPTQSSILIDNANLHDYVKNALPHGVTEIADPRIILLEQQDCGLITHEPYNTYEISSRIKFCLASVFEVGVLCSLHMPKERMDISVALKQLQMARDRLLND